MYREHYELNLGIMRSQRCQEFAEKANSCSLLVYPTGRLIGVSFGTRAQIPIGLSIVPGRLHQVVIPKRSAECKIGPLTYQQQFYFL
jgi:hypothetical protein